MSGRTARAFAGWSEQIVRIPATSRLSPASGRRQILSLLLAIACSPATAATSGDEPVPGDSGLPGEPLWKVELTSADSTTSIEGRILVEAQDGGLILEERNGRLRQLKPADFSARERLNAPFLPLDHTELAADLLRQVPPGFETFATDHYVLCSNSSQEYAEFCGRLLEKVRAEYFAFLKELEIPVHKSDRPLPVLVFHSGSEFQEFATSQHPETKFEDTPGYYSIRDNQMLLMDLTRDRSLRSSSSIRRRLAEQPLQVATIVHEAVHQLSFNSGLQVRLADNPLWLTEGLAMYFEPGSPRSSLLWNRPGAVNVRHQQEFARLAPDGSPEIPFSLLVSTDQSFLNPDSVAGAYAEGWALTAFLVRRERSGLKRYLEIIGQHKPLKPVTESERLEEFRNAFGKMPDEFHADAISFVRRLK